MGLLALIAAGGLVPSRFTLGDHCQCPRASDGDHERHYFQPRKIRTDRDGETRGKNRDERGLNCQPRYSHLNTPNLINAGDDRAYERRAPGRRARRLACHSVETLPWRQQSRGGTRADRMLSSVDTMTPPLIAALDYMPPIATMVASETALLAVA